MMHPKLFKSSASFVLAAIVSTSLVGVFGFPAKSAALSPSIQYLLKPPSVPVEGAGGKFAGVTQEAIDVTAYSNEIVRSEIMAAMEEAFQEISEDFTEEFEEQIGIDIFQYYLYALDEGKNEVYALTKIYGEDAVATSTQGDIYFVAADYESWPINSTYSSYEAAQLGAVQAQTNDPNLARQIRQAIVGATSLFTSSISCAGINGKAIENTANYLAAAAAGITADQIDPSSGTKWYEDMFKLGGPFATPPFWALTFQDSAARTQSEARQSSALELLSPGIKTPQSRNTSGTLDIARTLGLITSTQNKNLGSIFDITYQSANSLIPGGSLSAFLRYVTMIYSTEAIAALFSLPNTGPYWVGAALSYGEYVANEIVKAFVSALYDRLIAMVFKGTVLAESSKCRQPARTTAFDGSRINTTPTTTPSAVIFTIDPAYVNQGATSTLAWDATAAGVGATVSIDKVGEQRFGPLSISGTLDDVVFPAGSTNTTQEYRLEVNQGQASEVILSQTVTLITSGGGGGSGTTDFSKVTFDVQPQTVVSGEYVNVVWDASSVPGASVLIYPLSTTELPLSGGDIYQVLQETTFSLFVTAPNGDLYTQTITVTISNLGGASNKFYLSAPFRVRE